MGDQQFSSSRGHVLYVRDFLARYGPDALRYFICAAGPETSDAAFTWADFVTRNNSELVAGWGNLVNRTATMIAKNFGEIPAAGPLEPVDEDVLAAVRAGFDTVGDLLAPPRLRARHRRGDAGGRRGQQVPHRHRALQDEGRASASASPRSCTSPPSACSTATRCSRRSCPHAANQVDAIFGGEGELMPMPRIDEVERPRPRQRPGPDLPGHHRRLHRHAGLGVPPGDAWARRSPSRRRSSPSSTSTRCSPSGPDAEADRPEPTTHAPQPSRLRGVVSSRGGPDR